MCNACPPPTVPSAASPEAEAFGESLLATLNHAALGLALSLGHRTGLFDAMVGLGPVTSGELALAAGLNERYVREWLGAVSSGGLVTVAEDGEVDRFELPHAHAAVLARSGDSTAAAFQWMAVLGRVEDRVVDAFREGGGVPYEAYHRFHEVMAEESQLSVVDGLTDHVVPLVPGLAERLETGIDVLDVGCGSGRAVCALAAAFPRSRFTGYDLCDPAIEAARRLAAARGLDGARFETRDVTDMDEDDAFDLVTAFDAIHDQRDPAGVLAAIRRVLRPEGTFVMQDLRADSRIARNVDHPFGPFLYTISTMHCMTVSLAQDGAGLGAAWGEQLALRMLDEAGFPDVAVHRLAHDFQNNWYVAAGSARA